ncbi:hypothetical protein ACTXT7_001088 [Hymenolepis weldensis]
MYAVKSRHYFGIRALCVRPQDKLHSKHGSLSMINFLLSSNVPRLSIQSGGTDTLLNYMNYTRPILSENCQPK